MGKLRVWVVSAVLSALFVGFLPTQIASAATYPRCTINGTAGNDLITGTAGADVICSGTGNDTINSLGGNDIIIKGAGTAVINAGTGNDTIDVSLATSTTIDAGAGDDVIIGSLGDDAIDAGDGNDDVVADEGNDTVYGGTGTDSIDGGLGDNTLYGGTGDDTVLGDEGKDAIYGDAGVDLIDGGDGDDKLYGGAGDDTLIGGIDNDFLYGGDGNDVLNGDSGDDRLYGQAGIDTLSGQQGDDLLSGGLEIDSVYGGTGINICDFTVGETTTTTCKYDSSAPVISLISISPELIDVGSAAGSIKVVLNVTEDTSIALAHIECRSSSGSNYLLSYDFNATSFDRKAGGNFSNLAKTGDDKKLDVSFESSVSTSTVAGNYECYVSASDSLENSYSSASLKKITIYKTPALQPSAPTALSFTATSRTTGTLTWIAPSTLGTPALTSYAIQFSTDGLNWIDASPSTTTKTTYSFTGLKADTNYWFRVRGDNGATTGQDIAFMNLAWASVTGKTAANSVAAVPSGLVVSGVSSSGFTLGWVGSVDNGGSVISNYSVEVSADGGVSWVSVRSGVSVLTSVVVSGLSAGVVYQVRVAAVNGVGRSGYLTGSVTTSALVAPSDLKVSSIKATAATLTWKAPPLLGGTKVLDYVIDLSSGGVNWITITKKASTAESFSLANLRPGTLYQVRLFAIETKGKSEYLLGSFTTVTTLPSVPTKLTASNRSPYSFTLNWIQDSDGGSPITDYVVEVNGGGFNWAKVQKKSSAQTSCMISNLLPGVKYTMRVKAITALGASKVSPTITVSTFTTVPAPPTSLTLKSTNADIAVIAWIAPIDNGGSKVIDYQISFSTDLGQTWAPYARAVSTAAFTNFKGLKPKTTYWLTVSAKNINGISVVSQVLSFTTA